MVLIYKGPPAPAASSTAGRKKKKKKRKKQRAKAHKAKAQSRAASLVTLDRSRQRLELTRRAPRGLKRAVSTARRGPLASRSQGASQYAVDPLAVADSRYRDPAQALRDKKGSGSSSKEQGLGDLIGSLLRTRAQAQAPGPHRYKSADPRLRRGNPAFKADTAAQTRFKKGRAQAAATRAAAAAKQKVRVTAEERDKFSRVIQLLNETSSRKDLLRMQRQVQATGHKTHKPAAQKSRPSGPGRGAGTVMLEAGKKKKSKRDEAAVMKSMMAAAAAQTSSVPLSSVDDFVKQLEKKAAFKLDVEDGARAATARRLFAE